MIITVQPIILGPHTLPAIEINIDTATYSYFSSYMARPKPITTLAELKSIYLKALNAKYILLEDGDTHLCCFYNPHIIFSSNVYFSD